MKVTANTDTGADINVMPMSEAKRLNLPIQHSRMKIYPYGGKPYRVKGKYEGTTSFGDTIIPTTWYIVGKKVEPLLSGESAERLGIISFNGEKVSHIYSTRGDKNKFFIRKFPVAFEGTGTLKDYKVHIYCEEGVSPSLALTNHSSQDYLHVPLQA